MPPDEDDISDEGSEDEEEVGPKDVNYLGRGILTQEAEFVTHDNNNS
jgi:hypothetical protein